MAAKENHKNDKVRAVILAAGLGKRMRSATAKVLHPVLGKPIIWRVIKALDEFKSQNICLEQIDIVVGHNAQDVENYVKHCIEQSQFNCAISFHHQEKQLGTGHALMSVQAELKNFQGHLIVVPGDCPLLDSDVINSLYKKHIEQKSDLTVLSTILDNPKGYGRVIRSAKGNVSGIIEEKDASDKERTIKEIGTSIYCFNWSNISAGLNELKNDNKQGEYYLTDLVSWAAKNKHNVDSLSIDDWRLVMGVNSRLELQLANKFLNEMNANRLSTDKGVSILDPASTWISPEVLIEEDTVILPGCYLIGDIQIGKNCIIGPHTSVEGKVQIGHQNKIVQSHLEDCRIGNNCYIGPFTHLRAEAVIGDQVRVGNFVEVKKSNIGAQSAVGHLSYIGDTTIGKDVNIGAGTLTANYDHITKIKESTIIEDGASTGCNAVLVAPVKIGRDGVVAAGTVVTKEVEPGSLAVRRVKQENIAGWAKKRKQNK